MYARKRWAMFRRHKLFLNPLCELEHDGCLGIANEVHHKVAMEDGGAPYDLDNVDLHLQALPLPGDTPRAWSRGRARDDRPSPTNGLSEVRGSACRV